MTKPEASRRPKRRNAEETRARLLAVGETLFADHGFDRTTLSALAEAAGVTKAMVRYYYGDKAGLYAAVIDAVISDLLANIEANLPTPADPADAMAEFIEVFATAILARPNFPRIVLRDYLDGNQMARPETTRTLVQLMGKTGQHYEAGRAAGRFREVNAHMLHLSLAGSLIFFSVSQRFRRSVAEAGTLPDPKLEAAAFARHLRALILSGIEEKNIVLR